jgi:hypothetical protein
VRRLNAPPWPCGEKRRLCQFYSLKQGIGSAEAARSGGGSRKQEHARLGERDPQEWLSGEQFITRTSHSLPSGIASATSYGAANVRN